MSLPVLLVYVLGDIVQFGRVNFMFVNFSWKSYSKCLILFLLFFLVCTEGFLLKHIRVADWYRGSLSILPNRCSSRLLSTHNTLAIRKGNCVQVQCILYIWDFFRRVSSIFKYGQNEEKKYNLFHFCKH